MKQALQNKVFPMGGVCTQKKEIRTAGLSPSFELIHALNMASETIGDPSLTATKPKLRLIVSEVLDWYSSFGQDKTFLQSLYA